MKVMVTGHRGYVGVGIVKVLLEHGHQVVGFDRLSAAEGQGHPNLRQVKGDMTDPASILSAIEGCDAVVHAAIGSRVSPDDAAEYHLIDKAIDYSNLLPFQINVSGTFNLFEVARQAGIRQVVNISSAAVVFHHVIDRIDNHVHAYQLTAETPPNYRGYYGMNKYLQEQIGEFYAREYHQSVITLRPWWVVDGPAYQNRMGVDLTLDVHPLTPAGLVCRYDLGELVNLALGHAEINYAIYYPVTGPNCERYFDIAPLQKELGWAPRYSFQELAQTWVGAKAAR